MLCSHSRCLKVEASIKKQFVLFEEHGLELHTGIRLHAMFALTKALRLTTSSQIMSQEFNLYCRTTPGLLLLLFYCYSAPQTHTLVSLSVIEMGEVKCFTTLVALYSILCRVHLCPLTSLYKFLLYAIRETCINKEDMRFLEICSGYNSRIIIPSMENLLSNKPLCRVFCY